MDSNNNDYTIKPEQYAEVLNKFDRKKEQNKFTEANELGRSTAGSIGGETPLLVLMDIRKGISDLSNRIDESNTIMKELLVSLNNARDDDTIKNEQHHKDILAYMQQMSSALMTSRSSISMPSNTLTPHSKQASSTKTNSTYYYYDFEIKNSEAVIGCILMHLCIAVTNNLGDFNEKSTTIFGVHEWASAVKYVRLVGLYKLPKFTTFEVQQTLDIIASDTLGRKVVLKIEHIAQLCNNYPTIMVHVEEMRKRITNCPGIVTLSKSKQLATLGFPYVTNENTLNVIDSNPKVSGSEALVDMVKSLNDTQKRSYAKDVLDSEIRPIIAVRNAKSS